ncbi:MAG: TolC family protein [Phocaeicola vulgatus]|nr:MAG: TolC family protein [Phocaeicola vulgatus]
MDKVLQSVLEHNKELKAGSSQTEAQKLQARTENNLPDPEVSYVHQWGNKEGMGFSGEFVASQSFDFPTLYSQRSKRIKAESRSLDSQFALLRQQVLLQAKQVCLDLIYLNQLRSLQKDRLHNADILSRFYASQLEKGATNVIETNKVDLELLNARNEARQNEVAIKGKLEELKALNGGIEIAFADSIYLPGNEYPEDFNAFCMQALESLPEIQSLRENQAVAARQLTVSKQQWLPNLTLGYRMNPASGGERYDGVLVGISIPIFANRNKVKQAKAEHLCGDPFGQPIGCRESSTQAVMDESRGVEEIHPRVFVRIEATRQHGIAQQSHPSRTNLND